MSTAKKETSSDSIVIALVVAPLIALNKSRARAISRDAPIGFSQRNQLPSLLIEAIPRSKICVIQRGGLCMTEWITVNLPRQLVEPLESDNSKQLFSWLWRGTGHTTVLC